MGTDRQIRDDEPLMIAWKAHQETEEFLNSKKWAAYPEHLQGSLWALFSAGFIAAQSPQPVGAVVADELRNQVLEEVAALHEKFLGRGAEVDVGYIADSIRAMKNGDTALATQTAAPAYEYMERPEIIKGSEAPIWADPKQIRPCDKPVVMSVYAGSGEPAQTAAAGSSYKWNLSDEKILTVARKHGFANDPKFFTSEGKYSNEEVLAFVKELIAVQTEEESIVSQYAKDYKEAMDILNALPKKEIIQFYPNEHDELYDLLRRSQLHFKWILAENKGDYKFTYVQYLKNDIDLVLAAQTAAPTREQREAEQRMRMNDRFANRSHSPATADFDLPMACDEDQTAAPQTGD